MSKLLNDSHANLMRLIRRHNKERKQRELEEAKNYGKECKK